MEEFTVIIGLLCLDILVHFLFIFVEIRLMITSDKKTQSYATLPQLTEIQQQNLGLLDFAKQAANSAKGAANKAQQGGLLGTVKEILPLLTKENVTIVKQLYEEYGK